MTYIRARDFPYSFIKHLILHKANATINAAFTH